MFNDVNWSDSDDDEWAKSFTPKKQSKNKKNSSSSSLESSKGLSNGKFKSFGSKVKKQIDKCFNSPTMTKNLLSDDNDLPKSKKKQPKFSEPGALLRQGIKFSSEAEFDEYMTPSKKRKKKKKRKHDNEAKSDQDKVEENKVKKPKFDIDKLKDLISNDSSLKKPVETSIGGTPKGSDHHVAKLKSAQFRHLNEKLYTQSGSQSLKMFQNDPDSFKVYHEGFRNQAEKWPVDPLNLIIASIMKMNGTPTVADFGCGEARLARSLEGSAKVHSFDLVKINDYVTVCDFAHTPLTSESCNVVVFCLSLMGTNLKDFLKEAHRVLKSNGTLKVAEVASRFKDLSLEKFVDLVSLYGFKLKWKETKHEYFYLMDFKKISECKKKLPDLKLQPCVYKKR